MQCGSESGKDESESGKCKIYFSEGKSHIRKSESDFGESDFGERNFDQSDYGYFGERCSLTSFAAFSPYSTTTLW